MRRRGRWVVSFASLAAVFAANATFFPILVTATFIIVLVVHEAGHYLMARSLGNDAYPPVFLPLPLILVGFVSVAHDTPRNMRAIIRTGPMAGVIAAAILTMISLTLHIPLAAVAAGIALFWECWSLTLGGDGRRYRQEKRKQ